MCNLCTSQSFTPYPDLEKGPDGFSPTPLPSTSTITGTTTRTDYFSTDYISFEPFILNLEVCREVMARLIEGEDTNITNLELAIGFAWAFIIGGIVGASAYIGLNFAVVGISEVKVRIPTNKYYSTSELILSSRPQTPPPGGLSKPSSSVQNSRHNANSAYCHPAI